MKVIKSSFLLLLIIATVSCQKNEGTPIWRIWYAVQLPPEFDMAITYNSDKFLETGKLDTIYIHDSSYVQQLDGFWVGQHLQNDKEEGYYINGQIRYLTPFEGRIGVFVYANDTSLIDSMYYSYGATSFELSGNIPKIF